MVVYEKDIKLLLDGKDASDGSTCPQARGSAHLILGSDGPGRSGNMEDVGCDL